MHRSGTSALAGVIARLGAAPPKTLLKANPRNPTGYWESEALILLHDRLLASAGTRWDDWEPFNPQWFQSPVAPGFAEELQDAILAEFGSERFIVVKDPRLCRFLPLWLEQLNLLKIGVRAVIPVRNPLEISESLQKRNGLSVTWSLLLWLRHVLDAEAGSRGLPRSFVRYEDLLTDWRGVTQRLGKDLRVNWPKRSGAADREIDLFLSPELRHTTHTDQDLRVRGDVLDWIKIVFPIFARATRGGISAEDRAVLDSVRTEFDLACRAFGALMADVTVANRQLDASAASHQAKATELTGTLAERDSRLAELSGQTDEQVISIKELTGSLAERDSRIAELTGRSDEQATSIRDLTDSLAARDSRIAELTARTDERATRIEELTGLLAERDSRIAELSGQTNEQATRIEELTGSLAERDSRIEELTGSLAARDSQVAELTGSLAERDSRIEELTGSLAERDGRIEELTGSLADRDSRIAKLTGSLAERDSRIGELSPQVADQAIRIEALTTSLTDHEARLKRTPKQNGDATGIPGDVLAGHPARATNANFTDAQVSAVRQSQLFDANWYLATYPDVKALGLDPAEHYLQFGPGLERDPSPRFDTRDYLTRHPDVAAQAINPLLHHLGLASLGETTSREDKSPPRSNGNSNAVAALPLTTVRPAPRRSETGNSRPTASRPLLWVYRIGAVKSGTIMRGEQLSAMARRGLGPETPVGYVSEADAKTARDALLILTTSFLKDATLAELSSLRAWNNVVCVDYLDYPPKAGLDDGIDVYIASSMKQLHHLAARFPDKTVHLITHHVDPLIGDITTPVDSCRIGYFGELGNARYRHELKGTVDFLADDIHLPRRERRILAYQARTIASSGLFDRDWYLAQNHDVREAGADPILHYLTHGASEGRDPSPWFETRRYLAQNPDVAAADVNPLLHFARASEDERRSRLPPDQTVPQAAGPQAAGTGALTTRVEAPAAAGGK